MKNREPSCIKVAIAGSHASLWRALSCRCVQTVFAKEGEPPVCVFEHDADQPMWFGDRPSIHVQCSGKSTSLIPFDRYLAASWPQGKRHVTVIGERDVSDAVELVRQWDQQPDAA